MGLSEIKGQFAAKLKNTPKLWIYIGVAAACIVLLLMMRTPKSAEETAVSSLPAEPTVKQSYQEELERRLQEIISEIQGVGKVTVMVTISGSEENIYAEDISESEQKTDRETVIVGSKEALLRATKNPEVKGVLVVCTGGDRPQVQEKVVNAVSTVLDIPTNKVFVTKSK